MHMLIVVCILRNKSIKLVVSAYENKYPNDYTYVDINMPKRPNIFQYKFISNNTKELNAPAQRGSLIQFHYDKVHIKVKNVTEGL